ncbi:MAG: TonB-dependent receptor [Alphaproteobacteria bacterium]|nr:TonB-dependent receptor [Alphaproteobacteria bacterium]
MFRTVLACLLIAAPAWSQESQSGDVIVVTASRLTEPQGESAVPVAVLDEAALERIGAHHAAEALNRLPGVFIHRGNGVEHLTAVRSAVLTGGAGAGSFLYLQDGIALRAPGFANINGLMEASDALAARLEVIRGPGGAAYGSNALHGLVNVITPEPAEAGRAVTLEAGSFGRSRLEAYTGGETGFGAGYAGLSVRREDGWREDASLLRSSFLARADGRVGATDWSLRAALIDIDQETATFVNGFRAYEDEALSRLNADPEAFRNVRAARASLHLTYGLTDQARLELVGYGRSNTMDFRLHFLPSEALERTGHDSLGLQSALVWEGEATRLAAGVDADLTQGFLYEFQERPTLGPFVQGLHYDYTADAAVLAGFAQGRHELTAGVTLEGGLRVETTRYDYDTAAPAGATGRYLRPSDRTDDFTTVTPNLGLTWQITDATQLYARAARGVRAPQADELYRLQPGQVIEGIEPEELDTVEAGVRVNSGRFETEVTVFAMEKRNVFFRDADGFNVTDGQTRHHGVEFAGSLALTDSLTASASGSWAIHEYAFDRQVSRSSEAIVDGARLDTAPEWLWTAQLLWTPVDALELEAEWVHVGEYFADAGNTAPYAGHDVTNLRARYKLTRQVSVFTAIRNAFDVRYAERADFAFGGYRYFPGEPRSISLGVRISG